MEYNQSYCILRLQRVALLILFAQDLFIVLLIQSYSRSLQTSFFVII